MNERSENINIIKLTFSQLGTDCARNTFGLRRTKFFDAPQHNPICCYNLNKKNRLTKVRVNMADVVEHSTVVPNFFLVLFLLYAALRSHVGEKCFSY